MLITWGKLTSQSSQIYTAIMLCSVCHAGKQHSAALRKRGKHAMLIITTGCGQLTSCIRQNRSSFDRKPCGIRNENCCIYQKKKVLLCQSWKKRDGKVPNIRLWLRVENILQGAPPKHENRVKKSVTVSSVVYFLLSTRDFPSLMLRTLLSLFKKMQSDLKKSLFYCAVMIIFTVT